MQLSDRRTAMIFKSLSDENRIQIIKILRSGEKCACKLLDELQISQPTLSHHMKILCDAEIVNSRKEGKWMHYSINHDSLNMMTLILHELLGTNSSADHCHCKTN